MVPPAVLLPWVVLALLGVEGGSASKQEGKGGGPAPGRWVGDRFHGELVAGLMVGHFCS